MRSPGSRKPQELAATSGCGPIFSTCLLCCLLLACPFCWHEGCKPGEDASGSRSHSLRCLSSNFGASITISILCLESFISEMDHGREPALKPRAYNSWMPNCISTTRQQKKRVMKAPRWRIRRQPFALILALPVQPSMNGKAHEGAASQADSSTLYAAAKAHGNREAAAECSAKAGEALEAGDYDKAVSLPHECVISIFGALKETHLEAFQVFPEKRAFLSWCRCVTEVLTRQQCVQERLYAKAERLAPGVYTEEAAKAAAQRAEYEAWLPSRCAHPSNMRLCLTPMPGHSPQI